MSVCSTCTRTCLIELNVKQTPRRDTAAGVVVHDFRCIRTLDTGPNSLASLCPLNNFIWPAYIRCGIQHHHTDRAIRFSDQKTGLAEAVQIWCNAPSSVSRMSFRVEGAPDDIIGQWLWLHNQACQQVFLHKHTVVNS